MGSRSASGVGGTGVVSGSTGAGSVGIGVQEGFSLVFGRGLSALVAARRYSEGSARSTDEGRKQALLCLASSLRPFSLLTLHAISSAPVAGEC